MLVRNCDGSVDIDDFACCEDLILWYIGCNEKKVSEAVLSVVTEDGRRISIIIPNDRSTRIRVELDEELVRLAS
jgi:hypothetical protein